MEWEVGMGRGEEGDDREKKKRIPTLFLYLFLLSISFSLSVCSISISDTTHRIRQKVVSLLKLIKETEQRLFVRLASVFVRMVLSRLCAIRLSDLLVCGRRWHIEHNVRVGAVLHLAL
jgi:hypothetical protein